MESNRYQAVLTDETGCEFVITIDALTKSEVWEKLSEEYPECRVTQVLSQVEVQQREDEWYNRDPYDDDYGY